MLSIPFLARMTWDFIFLPEEDVQRNFAWTCYLFLLAIFVAMTNQVTPNFEQNLALKALSRSFKAAFSIFRDRVPTLFSFYTVTQCTEVELGWNSKVKNYTFEIYSVQNSSSEWLF